jgi:hypothetical protein
MRRATAAERLIIKAAFARATAARESTAGCYKAAIDALHRLHPHADRSDIANCAVAVITEDRDLVALSRKLSLGAAIATWFTLSVGGWLLIALCIAVVR